EVWNPIPVEVTDPAQARATVTSRTAAVELGRRVISGDHAQPSIYRTEEDVGFAVPIQVSDRCDPIETRIRPELVLDRPPEFLGRRRRSPEEHQARREQKS